MFVDALSPEEGAVADVDLPLEQLEEEIMRLSAHLAAATCRWLELLGEFDRRAGWEKWGCRSCADWLGWRCGLVPGSAREHVRVARALSDLPGTRAAFGRGELSYSQVRAITRVATADCEAELVMIARHATAAQLERVVRAYRGVLATELGAIDRTYERRYVMCSRDDDGSLVMHARLPAEEGATVVAALAAGRDAVRADGRARGDGVSGETRPDAPRVGNADALVLMAESLLAAQPASGGAERHQVVVHVDAATLARDEDDGGRCELDDGPALHPEAARRLACDASLVRVIEADGAPLSVGRRTRAIPTALRRALASRDGGCRFPGCSRRRFTDAHHIHHWARGGRTDLDNLVLLCRHHHRLVHEGGFGVEARGDGRIAFRRPDGRTIATVPRRDRGDHHQPRRANARAGLRITAETPVPHWYGDRLDLAAAVDAVLADDSRIPLERAPPGPPPDPLH